MCIGVVGCDPPARTKSGDLVYVSSFSHMCQDVGDVLGLPPVCLAEETVSVPSGAVDEENLLRTIAEWVDVGLVNVAADRCAGAGPCPDEALTVITCIAGTACMWRSRSLQRGAVVRPATTDFKGIRCICGVGIADLLQLPQQTFLQRAVLLPPANHFRILIVSLKVFRPRLYSRIQRV